MKLLFVFLAFLVVSGALGQSSSGPGCSVSVSSTARSGGSYQSGSGVSQIYDIVVTNNGRCSVDQIVLSITRAAGSNIQEMWNLQDAGNGHYRVTSFEPTLPVGNSVNAGMIINYPNTQTVPAASTFSATPFSVLCPSSCVGTSAAATTSATPQTASTTSVVSPATTTAASSGTATGNTGTCNVQITQTRRTSSSGSYQSGSGVSQIYDVTVTNTGSCGLTDIKVQIAIPAGATIQETFNLNSNGNGLYTVTSYGNVLPPGNTVNTGFIVNFPNTQTVPASGITTTLSSRTCQGCATQLASTTAAATAASSGSTSGSAAATTGTASTTGSSQNTRCTVTAMQTARSGSGTYNCGSGVCQIYDVPVRNSGQCAVNNIILQITLPAGASIDSTFNLQANGNNRYTVTSYEGTLPQGNTVNTGFIVSFPNTQTVPASGVSTSVATTTCNQCQQ